MSMSIKKCIESIYSEVGHNVMSECIMRYGLDKDECETWMSELIAGLSSSASSASSASSVSSEKARKVSNGKGKSKGKVEEASVAVESSVTVAACSFPIPFNKNHINENGCHGLAYNHGLFNQCIKKKLDTGNYCKNCQKESDQSGQPSCGTIEARLSSDLLEYTDPKGRKPIAYLKVLEKQKIKIETVKEFIMRENIEVDTIHFECNEQKRGRPKSKIAKQVEAATVEDLFATLVNDETDSVADTEIMSDCEDDSAAAVEAAKAAAEAKKSELAAEKEARVSMRCEETEQKKCEKEAKLQQLAAEKEAKAQQLAAEKEAKAQQLAAEKEAKQKEKEAKLQQIAAEKEAKAKQVAAEKEAKAKQVAAEKEAKLKQQAAQKEADKKLGKVPRKKPVKELVVKAPKVEEEEQEEEEVSVKAIIINGKKYLKSDSNMLYDPATEDAVGIYDAATNSIKELPEESDDELRADEYDSDN